MASLVTNISDLATSVATAIKTTRTWVNGNASGLDALATTNKTNLVAAINEVAANAASATGIDDANTAGTSTWSSQKISTELTDVQSAVEAEIPTLTDLIDDTTPSGTTVYSSNKTNSAISTAVGAIDLTDLIDDDTAATTTVYSSTHTDAQIATAVANLVDSAPTDLDTLNELATALQNDESGITTINTALGKRVAVDQDQTALFTAGEKAQALTNIGAASAASVTTLTNNVGTTDTDFASIFTSGLT